MGIEVAGNVLLADGVVIEVAGNMLLADGVVIEVAGNVLLADGVRQGRTQTPPLDRGGRRPLR